MSVFDLFSKRQRRLRGELSDVYTYDSLPPPLRAQIVHIIREAFGTDRYSYSAAEETYKSTHKTLCKEYGVFSLDKNAGSDKEAVLNFLLNEKSTERALDVVELCFKVIHGYIRDNHNYNMKTVREADPDDAIKELNERFKEHAVGYQFESNELIRIDSAIAHTEMVKPALALLKTAGFEGANDEFLNAHDHYRHSRTKECLVELLKALESTLKVICTERSWEFRSSDTAVKLLSICFDKGLVPAYFEAQFASLRSLLESGIPTIRNKLGGHGQGAEPHEVPAYVASFAIHITASALLFLIDLHIATRKV